jgi:hypothetical protein
VGSRLTDAHAPPSTASTARSDCLALDPHDENPVMASRLYANRAAAAMKLGRNEDAVADCTRSVELDEGYTKGYIRRANANLAVGGKEAVEQALRDLHKAEE